MKIIFSAIFLLVSFSSFAQIPEDKKVLDSSFFLRPQTLKGSPFAAFSATSTDGKSISDNNLLNKVTFINFWFEACAPCIAEMDALNKLYADHQDKKDFNFYHLLMKQRKKLLRSGKNIKFNTLSFLLVKIPAIF